MRGLPDFFFLPSEVTGLGNPAGPFWPHDPISERINVSNIILKHHSGHSNHLNVAGSSSALISSLLPFLPRSSHPFQNSNYHLYANDYQIYSSNPLLSSEFQIGTTSSLIYICFDVLLMPQTQHVKNQTFNFSFLLPKLLPFLNFLYPFVQSRFATNLSLM